MTTFTRCYIVLDAKGHPVGVAKTPTEAGNMAEAVAGPKRPALWLATSGDDNAARDNSSTDPAAMPQMAFDQSGIGSIDFAEAYNMDPKEVGDAVTGILRAEKLGRLRAGKADKKSTAYEDSIARAQEYRQSANAAGAALVAQNTKTEKMTQVLLDGRWMNAGARGVSLAPARISFLEADPNWKAQREKVIARNPKETEEARAYRAIRSEWSKEQKQRTFCVGSVPACRAACLVGTGKNVVLDVRSDDTTLAANDSTNYRAKIHRSLLLQHHPLAFMNVLIRGFTKWVKDANKSNIVPFGRLNVLSDLPWELICPEFFEHFKQIQFYDYTKVPGRQTPSNYHLTFSWSSPGTLPWVLSEMERGRNVAVPFYHPDNRAAFASEMGSEKTKAGVSKHPRTFLGVPVISGDAHDLRPLDQEHPLAANGPVVVGLRFKPPVALNTASGAKRARSDFGSFVVNAYEVPSDDGEPLYVATQVPAYTAAGDTFIREDAGPIEAANQAFDERVAEEQRVTRLSASLPLYRNPQ